MKKRWHNSDPDLQMALTRKPHAWGYEGISFSRQGKDEVILTGRHVYEISGKPLPNFLRFVFKDALKLDRIPSRQIGLDLSEEYARVEREVDAKRKTSPTYARLLHLLEGFTISTSGEDLLSHSHGQLSVEEVYRLLYEGHRFHVCDVVIFVTSTEEIQALYRLAVSLPHVKIIPYGGGTNVTGCLLLPPSDAIVISLDMRRYNRVLRVDTRSNFAVVQSGITGKELEDQLAQHGFTSGHEPDSYEFSTLGGWIATYASGMKQSRYGNIERIVLDFNVVNALSSIDGVKPEGQINGRGAPRVRHSHGSDTRSIYFGHEGNLGIVTEVTIKIHRLPELKAYNSLVFPSMVHGIRFMRAVMETDLAPASLRLVDNNQFRLGQSLKPRKSWAQRLLDALKRFIVLRVYGFDPLTMVAATMVMEGTRANVRHQERSLLALAKRYRGLVGGTENGRAGYNLTQAIAYIRDFLNSYGVIGETFETSVEWNDLPLMTRRAEEIARETAGRTPYFLSYRVTQIYTTGVCVYYTLAIHGEPETYRRLEAAIKHALRSHGGSISHHHGIGKVKSWDLRRSARAEVIAGVTGFKRLVDPTNVFSAGNNHCDVTLS